MNEVVIKYTNCRDCKYCEHNGSFQSHPKFMCHHKAVTTRNKVDAKYWYNVPILGSVAKEQIDIPDWCPLLKGNENVGTSTGN